MDVFALRESIVRDYERFSRSFCKIHADDLRDYVEEQHAKEKFWPSPLIQLNPHFVPGKSLAQLADEGVLHEECSTIFRFAKEEDGIGRALPLHAHQEAAIRLAAAGHPFVLTSGTGSGKSLAYFIPIVDYVLRQKSQKSSRRIHAIAVYPMNALCNSQLEELEKFLGPDGAVTFARYTGQESTEERQKLADNPPDILLTNYMMLELLLTHHDVKDRAILDAAQGLRFLVLDELHTYRGRQGADVAMLIRRVRLRFSHDLLCIGTSATMASEGNALQQREAVARYASRLFGAVITPEQVIRESLERVTVGEVDTAALAQVICNGSVQQSTEYSFSSHPLAIWVEQRLGLESNPEGGWIRRREPLSITAAIDLLATESCCSAKQCEEALKSFFGDIHKIVDSKNGRALFAFRLHQFVSGAGSLYTTMEAPGLRQCSLEAQQYLPGDRSKKLFNVCFCRGCGQEYYPVWATQIHHESHQLEPRDLNDRNSGDEEVEKRKAAFWLPDEGLPFDSENLEKYPEEWIESEGGVTKLKKNYRQYRPEPFSVDSSGTTHREGIAGWLVRAPFRWCLRCGIYYPTRKNDRNKLSGLSSEGRSTAMTMLTLSCLKELQQGSIPKEAQKLLAFTDNRQDASLQAGHFNDFIHVLHMRSALLAALHASSEGYLTEESLAQQLHKYLHLEVEDFLENPHIRGPLYQKAEKALRDVIGSRLYRDLQKGWRITSPNLEQLSLLEITYEGLEECCADETVWKSRHVLLADATPQVRKEIARHLLETMRQRLCIATDYLDKNSLQMVERNSQGFTEDWKLDFDGWELYTDCWMVPLPKKVCEKYLKRDHTLQIAELSYRSAFAREITDGTRWGKERGNGPKFKDSAEFVNLMQSLLSSLQEYGIIESRSLASDITAYRVAGRTLQWRPGKGDSLSSNDFFRILYLQMAEMLATRREDNSFYLHRLTAAEHTAQVSSEVREQREELFRSAELPVLFCSPTMELGIDIARLQTVYMRNVPPTPANYAQRSGRAGRSGQASLVLTYCSSYSPHDQYFFQEPARMVGGVLQIPNIDLANEQLVQSHIQAVWLAASGQELPKSIKDLLDLSKENCPVKHELMERLHQKKLNEKVFAEAIQLVKTIEGELDASIAGWYGERWIENVVTGAHRSFSSSFNRWRDLYLLTQKQMEKSHLLVNNHAVDKKQRDQALRQYNEVRRQLELLMNEQNKSDQQSDFYTYRYLACQGFLPGYNFPKLPLMAYVPGQKEHRKGKEGSRSCFLSRPRFLGLSEFGPRALLYHEGAKYRVSRVILRLREQDHSLPVDKAMLCPACGYAHKNIEEERCYYCNALLQGQNNLNDLYRIEQVSTERAKRITSDEEERQRHGYDILTTFSFGEGNTKPLKAELYCEEKLIARLSYSSAATIMRINLGEKRRKDKWTYGFHLDTTTGRWCKSDSSGNNEDDDENDEHSIATPQSQRITPYVEDSKNSLIVQMEAGLNKAEIITLMYALKRGMELVFQVEDNELAVEPLPNKEEPRYFLFYEAAEGGAGILNRLVKEAHLFGKVAHAALAVCHWSPPEPAAEKWTNLFSGCEAGCYRCLLSYSNQPMHKLIDRKNEKVLQTLLQSTHAVLSQQKQAIHLFEGADGSLERKWLQWLGNRGYCLPDKQQPLLEEFGTQPDFAYSDTSAVIYIDGPVHRQTDQEKRDSHIDEKLTDHGYTVIRFTQDLTTWDAVATRYPHVFGTPYREGNRS